MNHLKKMCIGCGRSRDELRTNGISFGKEHVLPEWLILRTNTNNTFVRWFGQKVHGLSATIPLCEECNKLFGEKIESPVKEVFDSLESGQGITDYEAELLVRWMWKLESMQWYIDHEGWQYSNKYTLRERVLNEIDNIRPFLTLSISLIKDIDPCFGDYPIGLDSYTNFSGLFVAGVFSKLAIMTSYGLFDKYIPNNFSKYTLANKQNKKKKTKVFFPATGFEDDVEAVSMTIYASQILQKLHDDFSKENDKRYLKIYGNS